MIDYADGFLWYLAFLFSTVLHEASHAFMAMKLGDDTAYVGGQVTLDPLPHIRREPFGMVVIPILTFITGGWMMGWASTPYDPRWAQTYPKRSALMALAGPASNLCMVIISGLIIHLGVRFGVFQVPFSFGFSHVTDPTQAGMIATFAKAVSIFFSLNLILLIFNLLPLPPLDGSGSIPLFLKEELSIKYLDLIHNPTFSIFGILIAWKLFDFVFGPILSVSLRILYAGIV